MPSTPEKAGLPPISDPKPDNKVRVTRREVRQFLKAKNLPITKKTRKRARNRIRRRKERALLPRGKDITIAQTDAPYQIIYGECIVGGVLTYINETNNRTYLNHIITLSGHEIESLETVYIDGNEVSFASSFSASGIWANGGTKPNGDSIDYTNKVFVSYNVGTSSQAALADAVSNSGGYWTSTHRQRGCAHAYVLLVWDGQLFGEGQPSISFKVQGKKVYDPRTTLTTYSNNGALVIADFLTDSTIGLGIDSSLIDYTTIETAADICDENVALNGGGTEKRYTIDGYFDHDEDKEEILDEMVRAIGGALFFSDGKWKLLAGAYKTPTLTLTEDDLRGVPIIENLVPKSESFNSIRGTFVSSENEFKVTEYPPIAPSAYITADDGRQVWADIDFPFTTSGTRAQRLANIELNFIRKPYRFSAPFGMRAYELEAGDVVLLTMDRYGFASVPFEVAEADDVIDNNLGMTVDLVLEQTGSDVYAWDETSDEGTVNVPISLQLPDPTSVTAPTSFTLASGTSHLYVRQDGTVFSRIYASWTAPDDPYVTNGGKIQVQYKQSASGTWLNVTALEGDATETYILDVEDGEDYDVRIRSENALGFTSSWVTVIGHSVVGKTAPPSNVSSVTLAIEESGLRISWPAITDLDVSSYEIRFGGANWAAATTIGTTDATSYLWEFPASGSYDIRVKAIDTSGNYSTTDATTSQDIAAPSRVNSLSAEVIDNNVLLRWTKPTTHTLAIDEYVIKKGATFATSTEIGRVSGTFHTIFEILSGDYTYWIYAIDVGGNAGTEKSVIATVQQPTDFVLKSTQSVTSWDTESSVEEITSGIWAGPVVGETFISQFTNNSWTTVSDKVSATDYWFQPAGTYGYLEKVIDLGATLGPSIVSFSYDVDEPVGTVSVVPSISISADNVTYTDYEGLKQAYGSSYRYVKIKLEFGETGAGASSENDLWYAELSNIQLQVNAQTKVDGGTGTADSADSGGTSVSFNKSFADVDSIEVTPLATTATHATYDFTDVANPTGFSVYLWNSSGTRVSGDFSWTATGI